MNVQETLLTPELAAQLLATPHPRQRRPAPQTVAIYARAMREGRWQLVADALLVDSEGRMFNGAHRCAAVVASHKTVPVMISWDADPELFDIIDVGRKRSAYQFIGEGDATARASAARITLWYDHRFERPLTPRNVAFDLQEIMDETERKAAAFTATLPAARDLYRFTSIPLSVGLGAFAVAWTEGYGDEVDAFARGVAEPQGLETRDPARLLAERYRLNTHRSRRREMAEDWVVLVRSLNLQIEGRLSSNARIVASAVAPRIGETEREYNRRRAAVLETARYRRNAQNAQTKSA